MTKIIVSTNAREPLEWMGKICGFPQLRVLGGEPTIAASTANQFITKCMEHQGILLSTISEFDELELHVNPEAIHISGQAGITTNTESIVASACSSFHIGL